LSQDYAIGRRAARVRQEKRSRFPFLLVALGLFVALIAVVFGFASQLRGPVVTSSWLRRVRTPEREALAERAFLSSQLALASNDSINIILDARKEKLWIVLKGVRLRECDLTGVALDSAIRKLVSGKNEAMWLERPFTLLERRGNLPDPWQPVAEGKVDTLKGGVAVKDLPMDGRLVFDRGLVVHINTPPTKADSLERRGVKGVLRRATDNLDEMSVELNEILNGPPRLDVYVQIRREDAAAVLRALSVGGGMALHI
jgi:hypothetical protein